MTTISRILKAVILIALIGAGVFAALNWGTISQIVKYSPVVLPSLSGKPANATDARLQDLKYLEKFAKIDRSFSKDSRAAFMQAVERMKRDASSMSNADFFMGVARAVALADNGHTNISSGHIYREFNRVPAKLFWFADGLYVVRAQRDYEALVGARVEAIAGQPVAAVYNTVSQYIGGADSWRKLYSALIIESPELLHAAGITPSSDEMTLSLVDREGEAMEVTLKGERLENQATLPSRRPWMTLEGSALPDEGDEWVRTLDVIGESALHYLRDSDESFYASAIDGGYYIRTNMTQDAGGKSLSAFYDKVLAELSDHSLKFLVVDLRFNPGGDYTNTVNFSKTISTKLDDNGRLYIVVGPQTFSAGLVNAALLKYYGGNNAIIIGAGPGDREQFWAERGMTFELPNSKYRINYATGYHDWENGCEGHPYCFPQNLKYQVPAGPLSPMVRLDPTYEEYAAGRDIVLDWIVASEAGRNGSVADSLVDAWTLAFNVNGFGVLETVVDINKGLFLKGSAKRSASTEGNAEPSVTLSADYNDNGVIRGLATTTMGDANFVMSYSDGALSGTFEGDMNGVVTGTRADNVSLPLRDYQSILNGVDQLTQAWLYDTRLMQSDEWAAFHDAFVQAATSAQDDFDMVSGFNKAWGPGLFSHYELRRLGQSMQEMLRQADARADDKPIARIEFTDDNIALITIDTFFGTQIAEQIDAVFEEAIGANPRAMVIDLRENGGGTLSAWPVSARLMQHEAIGGYFISNRWWSQNDALPTTEFVKATPSPAEISPLAFQQDLFSDGVLVMRVAPGNEATYAGPVYVLISKKSRSATEALVGVLQYVGRVTVVGENSGGYMLNSNIFPVSDDYTLRIPVADFFLPNHKSLEAVGVSPDIATPPEQAMAAALESIRSE